MNNYEKLYTVDDIAQMTMLTTRTIRNYLKDGLLTGRKVGGQWRFTSKDIEGLFANSAVETDIKISRRQEVMDFIDGINTDIDGDIQICTIIDYYCSDVHIAKKLSDRFSEVVLKQTNNTQQKYYYEYIENEKKARYTLFGTPTLIRNTVVIIEEEWNKLNSSLSKFTDKAKNYTEYRPSYPKDAVNLIFSVAGNGDIGKSEISIADIGAGTGKMSKLLLVNNNVVYAIEPNSDMRFEAEAKLSDNKFYKSINGTGEKTTLNANSVDLITCAEAYHWFDNEKTQLEFRRILKPNGYVFLLWNLSGDNSYTKELVRLNEKFCKSYKSKELRIPKDERAMHLFGEGGYKKAEFDNIILQPYEALLGGLLSASYSPKEEDEHYDEYVKGVKNIFHKYSKDGMIETKFITVCYYGKLE